MASAARTSLQLLLVTVAIVFTVVWFRAARKTTARFPMPTPFEIGVGAVTDFLDTLGIGSFATTTTAYRLSRRVDDRLVPGTLNVGHALPTVVQALIYISIVQVEVETLIVLIVAAVLGSVLGARTVSRWSRRRVRLAMGAALLIATTVMVGSATGILPKGGEAHGISGTLLAAAAVVNFVLGALMCAGVGLYAPCMILVSLLGMNPVTAFPIMMGSCAFLMQIGGLEFIRRNTVQTQAAIGLALGGIPAVIVAAFVVRSLPLDALRWLVAAAAAYTAVTLLVAGSRESEGEESRVAD